MEKKIDNKLMVFESHPDFADNSRGLWEYVEEHTDYATFWIVRDEAMEMRLLERGIQCAIEGSELAESMISKARFLVSSGMELAYQKKSGQIHISAWHGFPLKVIGFFDGATTNPDDFDWLKTITIQTDIITAPSRLAQLTISGMFAVDPRKTKITGYPRNDYLYTINGKENLKKILRQDIENSKLIFYLPTMRKGLKAEGAGFEDNIFNYSDWNQEELDCFLESNNAYIVTKMHFADNKFFNKQHFKLPRRVIFLDTQALEEHCFTIYHIMNAFDVLITDYSSVYVDYLLLDRPIVFSCPDLLQYQQDRGFVVDDPTLLMPGAIVDTQQELIGNLQQILNDQDNYKDIRQKKMSFFHTYKDANSARRLFEEMIRTSEEKCLKDSSKSIAHHFINRNTPLYQYSNKINIEVFLDLGEGFNEATKKVFEYYLHGESEDKVNIKIDLPPNCKQIRLDPDQFGRCGLMEFKCYVDDEEMMYQIQNAVYIEKKVIPINEDPQIIVTLQAKGKNSIQFVYKILDIYENAGEIIKILEEKIEVSYGEMNHLRQQLSEIENSKAWKITKPIRAISNRLKAENEKK